VGRRAAGVHSEAYRRQVATAIAGAFLAGEWDPAAMGRRAKRALADRRHWPTELARIVVHEYPDRPADRPRELARFVAACPPFVAVFRDRSRPPPRVHVWMAAPGEMGPARWPVPPIADLARLAAWLGVTPAHLDWFADRRSLERTAPDERLRHYRRRWVRKADGSVRLLEAPKRELKDLQRQVLHHILDAVPPHPAAHGFHPGRSVITAAAPHAGRDAVLRLDLEAFFACVDAGRVYGIFRLAGYPEPVAHTLAALCTTTTPLDVRRVAPRVPAAGRDRPDAGDQVERRRRLLHRLASPHLAQGSPTSPALANLTAHRLDRRLTGLARRLGATYTRYADDLVLSGDRSLLRSVDRIVDLVGDIASDEGFRLNAGKTRVATAARRQTVAGLVVNRHPNVARDEYDRLRAVLHDAARSGPAAANRSGHPDFRAHLLGRISWVSATNPSRARKLTDAFAAIAW
jgi:RNA-directed DNA polymerase